MNNAVINAKAWGHQSILDFFKNHRKTTEQVYASEWVFLEKKLKEGVSILDIGCAQGGFANIFAEQLKDFKYTGIDIN